MFVKGKRAHDVVDTYFGAKNGVDLKQITCKTQDHQTDRVKRKQCAPSPGRDYYFFCLIVERTYVGIREMVESSLSSGKQSPPIMLYELWKKLLKGELNEWPTIEK